MTSEPLAYVLALDYVLKYEILSTHFIETYVRARRSKIPIYEHAGLLRAYEQFMEHDGQFPFGYFANYQALLDRVNNVATSITPIVENIKMALYRDSIMAIRAGKTPPCANPKQLLAEIKAERDVNGRRRQYFYAI